MENGETTESVRKALRDGPFAMRQLAQDSGLSYDVLRSWRSGRRRPNPDSVRKLADGLARRSEALRDLARQLSQQQGSAGNQAQETASNAGNPAHQ